MKLLLVEDDVVIAEHLERGLGAEGFRVEVVHNGNDGLRLATDHDYDLVILDIMLPGLNGYRVCSELRTRGIWTPILMLTAKAGDLDEAEGLDTGADDYLTKPFSFAVLVARIRALTRRHRTGPPAATELGQVRLDPISRRVWNREVEVQLTSREFDVLDHLIRHPDRVISKQDLLDAIWDHTFDGDPNIVEVYIGRLRRKVGTGFEIETVRGAGYRVVER